MLPCLHLPKGAMNFSMCYFCWRWLKKGSKRVDNNRISEVADDNTDYYIIARVCPTFDGTQVFPDDGNGSPHIGP
jgi:hypothetical protein